MAISLRIQTVAAAVSCAKVAADIGCDHALTAVELIRQKRADRVIAADIKKAPLDRAKKTVESFGLSDKISLRLSDGLEAFFPGEADTVVLSGMGGALTVKILSGKKEVTGALKQLVLSPQSEIFLVRHFLHENGFCIASENMITENGKYYVIMRAVPGTEKYDDAADYLYGRCLIESASETFFAFMQKEKKTTQDLILRLSGNRPSEKQRKRLEKLKQQQEIIDEVTDKINKKREER